MKINQQDIMSALEPYHCVEDEKTRTRLVDEIYHTWHNSRTLFKMSDKLIALFDDFANCKLSRKNAKKLVAGISCQTQLSELIEELQKNDILKDKLSVNRSAHTILLKVHDYFIVKTDLTHNKTYLNDKFWYGIEEQDLLECYCDFVNENQIYILYKSRRLLSFIGLAHPYLKTINKQNKLSKLKRKKSIYMIFNNKDLIYKEQ